MTATFELQQFMFCACSAQIGMVSVERLVVNRMALVICRRDCIGQSLANVTAISTLARLYGSFSFQLSEEMGGPAAVRAAEHLNLGVISPAHGLKVLASPRVPNSSHK